MPVHWDTQPGPIVSLSLEDMKPLSAPPYQSKGRHNHRSQEGVEILQPYTLQEDVLRHHPDRVDATAWGGLADSVGRPPAVESAHEGGIELRVLEAWAFGFEGLLGAALIGMGIVELVSRIMASAASGGFCCLLLG